MGKEKEENFEESMKQLEEIVSVLEKGDLNLEDSVTKFEEGMKLAKNCNEILEKSEKKIMVLLEKDGTLTEENFEGE